MLRNVKTTDDQFVDLQPSDPGPPAARRPPPAARRPPPAARRQGTEGEGANATAPSACAPVAIADKERADFRFIACGQVFGIWSDR